MIFEVSRCSTWDPQMVPKWTPRGSKIGSEMATKITALFWVIFGQLGSQNAPNGSLVGPFWGLGSALGHFGRPGDPKAAQGTPF